MHTLETTEVGRFTVKLYPDNHCMTWEDVLCDQPVMVLRKGRYGRFDVLFDNSKQVPSGDAIYFAMEDSDWEEILSSVYGLDWEVLEDGRVKVDAYTLWDRPRYFKTLESATRRVLEDDSGLDVADFRLHQLGTRDAEVLLVWNQPELDRYAGIKDAKAPLETVQAYLDGEVYGWTVEDADGNDIESCFGYIGDARDVLAEAESVARLLEADAQA